MCTGMCWSSDISACVLQVAKDSQGKVESGADKVQQEAGDKAGKVKQEL